MSLAVASLQRRSRGRLYRSWGWLAVLVAVGLSGCGKTVHSYRYPNSVGGPELVVEPDGGLPALEGRGNEVALVGAAPPQAPDSTTYPPREKVRIGSFVGLWTPASIYWVDAATVNVCPLAKDPRAKTAVTILITERTRQVYRITTDCAKAPMAARTGPRARS